MSNAVTTHQVLGLLKRAGTTTGRATGRKRDRRSGVTVRKSGRNVSVFAGSDEEALTAALVLQDHGLKIWTPVTRSVLSEAAGLQDMKCGCFVVSAA